MSKRVERTVWLLCLVIAVWIAGIAGHVLAKQQYRREAVGNLNQVPLIVTKALWVLRERPDELPVFLETTLDSYSGSIWEEGRGMPEVTNTLRLVKKYRSAHPDYSPDPASEQMQRLRRTQDILAEVRE